MKAFVASSSALFVALCVLGALLVEQTQASFAPWNIGASVLQTPPKTAATATAAEQQPNEIAFLMFNHKKGKKHQKNSGRHLQGDVDENEAVVVPQKYIGKKDKLNTRYLRGDVGDESVRVPQNYGRQHKHRPTTFLEKLHLALRNDGPELSSHAGSRSLQSLLNPIFDGVPQDVQKRMKSGHRHPHVLVGVPHHRHGIVFPGLVDLEHGKPAKLAIQEEGPHMSFKKIINDQDEPRSDAPKHIENFTMKVYEADSDGKIKKVYDSSQVSEEERQKSLREVEQWMDRMSREFWRDPIEFFLKGTRLSNLGRPFPLPPGYQEFHEPEQRDPSSEDTSRNENETENELQDSNNDGAADRKGDNTSGYSNENSESDQSASSNKGDDQRGRENDTEENGEEAKETDGKDQPTSSDSATDASSEESQDSSGSEPTSLIIGIVGAVFTVGVIGLVAVRNLRNGRTKRRMVDLGAENCYINLEDESSKHTPQPNARDIRTHDRYVKLNDTNTESRF